MNSAIRTQARIVVFGTVMTIFLLCLEVTLAKPAAPLSASGVESSGVKSNGEPVAVALRAGD